MTTSQTRTPELLASAPRSQEDGAVLLRLTLVASGVLAAIAPAARADTLVSFSQAAPPAAAEIVITGDTTTPDERLIVEQSGSTYTITRKGTPAIQAGSGCTRLDGFRVVCTHVVPSIAVELADGNDTLETTNVTTPLLISGGSGDDALTGGAG